MQARQQIAAFEAALENAVRYGAQMLDQRLQASSAANMVMLAGMARARGFRLDDYGVMFDVEFPSMRRSMVWSLQELERATVGSGRAAPPQTGHHVQPREIYQTEITRRAGQRRARLHGGRSALAPDEWLTVAARESVVDRRFIPGDPNDAAMTVILRIKGGDLQALREAQSAARRGPEARGRETLLILRLRASGSPEPEARSPVSNKIWTCADIECSLIACSACAGMACGGRRAASPSPSSSRRSSEDRLV